MNNQFFKEMNKIILGLFLMLLGACSSDNSPILVDTETDIAEEPGEEHSDELG